jgi:hypothetical protein
MAHHKRRRTKDRRAGHVVRELWKGNGFARRTRPDAARSSEHPGRRAADLAARDPE